MRIRDLAIAAGLWCCWRVHDLLDAARRWIVDVPIRRLRDLGSRTADPHADLPPPDAPVPPPPPVPFLSAPAAPAELDVLLSDPPSAPGHGETPTAEFAVPVSGRGPVLH